MNYEHDNEFGRRPEDNRREARAQRGEIPRRPVSPEGRRTISGRDGESMRTYRRDGAVYRERSAGKETAAGREPAGRMPGDRRMEGAGDLSGTRRPSGSRSVRGEQGSGRIARRTGTIPPPGENPRGMVAQAKIQKAKKRKQRRRIIAMIVAECFALLFIFTYGYFARRLNMIQRADFDPKEVGNNEISLDTIQKMKGYRMIAVFGVDSRSNNVGAGCQSDVIMICCINEDTGDIKLVSVYRDTYLNINNEGSYRKVNAAYTNGGPEQALRTLNKNLDLNITDYITFSWKAVAEGINILGGVDLEVTRSEFKYINGFITETVKATGIGSHQLKSAGPQHLDGVQAVAYGRLRLMDTDYARTERQRKIIELAFAKAKQADYTVLNNILVVVLPNVSTNITFADMTSMALGISKYHITETTGFPFAKGNANIPGKGDCVVPQTLESNVKQLHTFLFGDEDYQTTEQVKQISNKIAADTGMYKEGTPFKGSALSTDGYVPEETTRAASTEGETTASEDESSEESSSAIPWETDEHGNIIGISPNMTDENGELIDAPIDDWPEEEVPGPSGPGDSRPGATRPVQPGDDQRPDGPGSESSAGSNNQGPGGNMNPQGPGNQQPGDTNGNDTGPGGSSSPGGNEPGSVMPGDNNSSVPGDNNPSVPGRSSSTPTQSWEAGPGVAIQNSNESQESGTPGGAGTGDGSDSQGPG